MPFDLRLNLSVFSASYKGVFTMAWYHDEANKQNATADYPIVETQLTLKRNFEANERVTA